MKYLLFKLFCTNYLLLKIKFKLIQSIYIIFKFIYNSGKVKYSNRICTTSGSICGNKNIYKRHSNYYYSKHD